MECYMTVYVMSTATNREKRFLLPGAANLGTVCGCEARSRKFPVIPLISAFQRAHNCGMAIGVIGKEARR